MQKNLHYFIWASTLAIIMMGLLAIYSASFSNLRVTHEVFYDQLGCAVFGFLLMFILGRVDYRRYYDHAYFFYAVSILLLVLVIISGRLALGAQRWLTIGTFSFQPSEVAKLALILGLGRYFAEYSPSGRFSRYPFWTGLWSDLILPFFMTLVPMFLIFIQPDLGSSILFIGIFVAMLTVTGVPSNRIMVFLAGCLLVVPLGWHILKPYQKDRLLVFLNPNIDPLGAGYTIIQSKIAMGSGQLFGKGWLAGTQNQLNFLPECHTDFIFGVVGEEWGLIGTLFLLANYGVLIYCGFKIAEQIKDRFGTQVAVGISAILTLQVVINMGMVLGLLPVVGITLPLVSYGRTSFMIFVAMLGILLSLSRRRTIF